MTGLWQSLGGKATPPGDLNCEQVLAQLYEYIDGELDENLIEEIRAHLKKCKCCYPRYDFEAAFLRFLGEHGKTEVPSELKRKVFAAILEEERSG